MLKIYILYGAVIVSLFAFSSYTGHYFFSSFTSGSWSPSGPRGYGTYHK